MMMLDLAWPVLVGLAVLYLVLSMTFYALRGSRHMRTYDPARAWQEGRDGPAADLWGAVEPPVEPRNTWSNLAYYVTGWTPLVVGGDPDNQAAILFGAAMTWLCIGSALFHGTLTTWGQRADHSAMLAAFPVLAIYAAGSRLSWIGAPMLFAGFVGAVLGTRWFPARLGEHESGPMNIVIGLLLVFTAIPAFDHGSPLLAGIGLAVFAGSAILSLWLDKRGDRFLGRWKHACWHLGTAAALALLFAAQGHGAGSGEASHSLTGAGMGDAPASHLSIVRGSRSITSRANLRIESPDASMAARRSAISSGRVRVSSGMGDDLMDPSLRLVTRLVSRPAPIDRVRVVGADVPSVQPVVTRALIGPPLHVVGAALDVMSLAHDYLLSDCRDAAGLGDLVRQHADTAPLHDLIPVARRARAVRADKLAERGERDAGRVLRGCCCGQGLELLELAHHPLSDLDGAGHLLSPCSVGGIAVPHTPIILHRHMPVKGMDCNSDRTRTEGIVT